jgi:hypothetical protein
MENLRTSDDFSFAVQLDYWLNNVPFVPEFVATEPKTLFEYSYLKKLQVNRVLDAEEWERQIKE